MASKKSKRKTKSDDSKLFAFLAVFLSILGFIIALVAKKEDKYVMHYAKQSLIIFLAFLASGVVSIVPLIGWVIGPIMYIISIVLWIIGWIYSLSGEEKIVPIIGQYAEKISL